MINNALQNELKKYLAHLQFERNLSENTINSYWIDLKKFFEYLEFNFSIKKINEIKRFHIETYIENIYIYIDKKNREVDKKKSSINRSISSIKNFYKYLANNDFLEENPAKSIQSIRQSKKIPDVLDVEEINSILNVFNTSKRNDIRDKSIISLLYSSGLRVSELTDLKLTNLFLDDDIIRIFGKGNKERIVPIGSVAKKDLNLYINNVRPYYTRKGNSRGLVYLSNRCKSLSRKTVWNIIKKSCTKASISKNVSPHTFRHSFASHLLEGGAGLRVVQELLGHSSISTTQIYTQLDKTYLKEIHKEFHPRG